MQCAPKACGNPEVTTRTRPMQPTEHDLGYGVTGMGAGTRARTDRTLKAALEHTERKEVEKVLARANGNVAEAAAMLGILRTSLYRIMKRCGIASPSRAGN